MEDRGISPADMINIQKSLKKAEEDTTPFAVVQNKEVSVIGDANRTEVKKNDYTISFRMPKEKFETPPPGAIEVGDYYSFDIIYSNVTITPRKDLVILGAIMEVYPFFRKLEETGSVSDLEYQELLSVLASAGDKVMLAIYNLIAAFLGIPDDLAEWMKPASVILAIIQFIGTHPEMFNEADVFFG